MEFLDFEGIPYVVKYPNGYKWAFHCENDPVVDVGESVRMVNAVNQEGGNAKITVYPDNQYEDKHDA